MGRIKDFFVKVIYGLPFGLKGADAEIMGDGGSTATASSVTQEVSDERVAKHLLKGEVTSEVAELRYRTYRVADESEGYEVGSDGGFALKKPVSDKAASDKYVYKFRQDNELLCEGVLDTLNQVGSYGTDNYRLDIRYSDFVRYRTEKYATCVDVDINNKDKFIKTTFHFSSAPNPFDAANAPFISELRKLSQCETDAARAKCELATDIASLSFCTYKATNEENFTTYTFIGGKFVGVESNDHEFKVTYDWDSYMRLPLNLTKKYHSESMEEKYRTHEKKNATARLSDIEQVVYCGVCGKEMNRYDWAIQKSDGAETPTCNECLSAIHGATSWKEDNNYDIQQTDYDYNRN